MTDSTQARTCPGFRSDIGLTPTGSNGAHPASGQSGYLTGNSRGDACGGRGGQRLRRGGQRGGAGNRHGCCNGRQGAPSSPRPAGEVAHRPARSARPRRRRGLCLLTCSMLTGEAHSTLPCRASWTRRRSQRRRGASASLSWRQTAASPPDVNMLVHAGQRHNAGSHPARAHPSAGGQPVCWLGSPSPAVGAAEGSAARATDSGSVWCFI